MAEQQDDSLRFLSHERDAVRVPSEDSNRMRWPLYPLWIGLQEQIATLSAQVVYRAIAPGALLNERMTRIAIRVIRSLG